MSGESHTYTLKIRNDDLITVGVALVSLAAQEVDLAEECGNVLRNLTDQLENENLESFGSKHPWEESAADAIFGEKLYDGELNFYIDEEG